MPIFSKVKLKRTLQNNVTFTYEQNGVNLNFTLDVNNKQQMKDFRALLKAGLEDVNEHLFGTEGEELEEIEKGA